MKFHLRYWLIIMLIAAGCRKADVRTPSPPPQQDPESDDFLICGVGPDSEYKGGTAGWLKFLSETVKYPDSAVDCEIQGTVHIRFVIERDGTVSGVQALDGPGILQQEAIRVISLSSGSWQPAMQAGRTVKSCKTQPIVFQLKVD
jgi:protein TonB